MSVFTLHHHVRYTPADAHGSLRGAIRALFTGASRVTGRIADGAVDSPVLRSLGAPAPVRPEPPVRAVRPRPVPPAAAARPRAHWQAAIGEDGRRHLEAAWHPEI